MKDVNKEADRKIREAKRKAQEATEKAERIAKEAQESLASVDSFKAPATATHSVAQKEAAEESSDDEEEQQVQTWGHLSNQEKLAVLLQGHSDDFDYISDKTPTVWPGEHKTIEVPEHWQDTDD